MWNDFGLFQSIWFKENTLSYCQHARSQIEEKENKMSSW